MAGTEPDSIQSQRLLLPSKGDVICCGFLTHCMLVVVEDFPVQNGGAVIENLVDTVGDDAAIVARTLSGWNVPSTLVSNAVGDDYYGSRVLEKLKNSGLDISQTVSEGVSTPLEIGIVAKAGSRTYFQQREPEVLKSLPVPSDDQLSDARMLYVDWYDGPNILGAMERAHAQAVPVFLNLESRYLDAPDLADLLRFTTVCQVSLDEPDAIGDPVAIGQDLTDAGISVVLVTMGAQGCMVAQGDQRLQVRPLEVNVVDAYGAGAAFSAGMIYGFQAGWPLERGAQFAAAYAGISCEIAGHADVTVENVEKVAEGLATEQLG
jgi:sugar/nucleoside kinase (ribokinase family)